MTVFQESIELVVGWGSGLTQRRSVIEVKHGRARSGVGYVTASTNSQATESQLLRAIVPGANSIGHRASRIRDPGILSDIEHC